MDKVSRRLTFGLVIDQITSLIDQDFFQSIVINGVADFARKHDISLVCFVSGKLYSPFEWERNRNIMLDFICPEQIHGLIILSTALGGYASKQQTIELLKKFGDIPHVDIGETNERYPSIVGSSYPAMYELIEHVIVKHGSRQPAFIKGPPHGHDSETRLNAYRDVLRNQNIPYNPELVYTGDYQFFSGQSAIKHWTSHNIAFDAIISSNDNMALGAINELTSMYGYVPSQLPIVGFDDAIFAQQLGLTTTRQDFYGEAYLAASSLYKMIRGEHIPIVQEVPSKIIYRSTCGCLPDVIKNAAVPLHSHITNSSQAEQHIRDEVSRIYDRMGFTTEERHQLEASERTLLTALFDGFETRTTSQFYQTWSRYMSHIIDKNGSFDGLHEILSTIRKCFIPILSTKEQSLAAENLFQTARLLVSNAVLKAEANMYYFSSLQHAELDLFSEELYVNLDINEQMNLTCQLLLKYGIKSGFVALYENPDDPMSQARLIMALHNHERIDTGKDGILFPTRELLPAPIKQQILMERSDYIVQALQQGNTKLGFVIIGFDHKISRAYDVIRNRLSVALKSAISLNAERNHSLELERQVAHRTQELTLTNTELREQIAKRQEAEIKLRKAMDELAALNADLQLQSRRDVLTGLLNRRGFMEIGSRTFEQAAQAGHHYLIMFADVDRLKHINDRFGHDEGDRALIKVAALLKSSLPPDSILARISGDEFTAIIPLTSSDDRSENIRNHVLTQFEAANHNDRLAYPLSISIGFAHYEPMSKLSFTELLKKADDRMYEIKTNKRTS